MPLFATEEEKQLFRLMLKEAVTDGVNDAMEKHMTDKHAVLEEDAKEIKRSLARLHKFKTQVMTVGGIVGAAATWAWTDIKGFFHHN